MVLARRVRAFLFGRESVSMTARECDAQARRSARIP